MARNRKSGKFSKTTRRRKSKPKMNLTNLAVSALVANSVSNNVAGIGIWDFFTAGSPLNEMSSGGWQTGTGGAHHSIITLREILSGSQSDGKSIGDAFMSNFKENWLPLTIAVVGIPIAANVATKLLRKPMILPLNRMLKSTGLDVKV